MSTTSTPAAAIRADDSRSVDGAAFLAGGLAAALGIAVGELVAGLVAGAPSLVIAIGDFVIANQPPGGKEIFVELFGEADKLVLNVMIVAASILIAGLLGVAGRRNWAVPLAGFGVAGLVGLVAALSQPLTEAPLAIVTVAAAILVALLSLRLMLATTNPTWRSGRPPSGTAMAGPTAFGAVAAPGVASIPGAVAAPGATAASAPSAMAAAAAMPDWDRRRFLQVGGGVAVTSVVLGLLGRNLLENRPGGAAEGVELPTAAGPVAGLPAAASLDVAGITPIVVPNDEFYRIDTALVAPRVNVDDWRLTINGMVDRETSLTYAELSSMPLLEQFVTIACVSNEVGGRLVGNALWTGVDLREVLDMAGVRPDADQVVGRSVDGFTAGFPTAWAMDPARRPMIALGMNGSPLPVDHGFPARLIIPGLYGYVSATKWLSEIELTTWEAFDGYWIPRGWAKEAPILTQSRIDVPRHGATVKSGANVAIAGVAWAPDRGVSAVEVSIDDGDWQPAQLSEALGDATWVQWLLPWVAQGAGGHRVTVRATDGEGVIQTDEVTRPAPDGARGHHSIQVNVS